MAFRFARRETATAEFQRLLHHASRAARPRRHFYVAVVALHDGAEEFAGISGFDVHGDGTGEFGWYLDSKHWNKGLATEATALWLRVGFDQLVLPLLKASCDPENAASRRVLEKSGLRLVGQRSEPIETWRGPRTRLDFALNRDEWDYSFRA